MPFTPFHLGPGLLLKAAAPRRISALAYAASQVVIDLESGYHLLTRGSPVHRELHTFALGGAVGALGGVLTVAVARRLVPRPGSAAPELSAELGWSPAVIGGTLGGLFHSLLDGIMHADIRPFRPFSDANPLRGILSLDQLHAACVVAGAIGALWLLGRVWRGGRSRVPSGT